MDLNKVLFITSIFEQEYPEKHKELWLKFQKEVLTSRNKGVFGADKIAYVKWLKEIQEPTFIKFIKENVDIYTY